MIDAKVDESWLASLKIYLDRRVIAILLLGFSSGLPILLVLTTLGAWLRLEGVDKSTIGLFGFVMAPYALKFIWAPLVDRLPIPGLTAMLGRRRSWMLITQVALVGAIYGLGQTDPRDGLYWTAVFCVLITFFSATQDIVIDAFRIDSLPADQLGAGASVVVLGYRIGMWVATAGAFFIADSAGWSVAYSALAAMMVIGIATTLFVSEPDGSTTALIDEEAIRQEARIRTLSAAELKHWRGRGGLVAFIGALLLVVLPASMLLPLIGSAFGHGTVDLSAGGLLVATAKLALAAWGAWIGWLILRGDQRAPGECKDFVMVALLALIAEIVAFAIPQDSIWLMELYAWLAMTAIWMVSNLVTNLFGVSLDQASFLQPVWLFTIGLWIKFLLFVFLYGFFYFSRRAVANFGLVKAEDENRIHLWTRRAIVEPYYDFFHRHGVSIAVAILLLISVFKASDAVLTSMANPFYVDVGLTLTQIAWVSKTFGLWMTLIGGIVGGLVVHRFGMMRSMVLAVIVMALSNLMFALLAYFGADALTITDTAFAAGRELTETELISREQIGTSLLPLFYALIIIENISGGLGTAVFVAYLSSLCNRSFSAVQYAMLTSFMQMFAKFIVVPSSGFYAEGLGWFGFFVTSTLFAVPALLLLWYLARRLGEPKPVHSPVPAE